MSATEHIAVDDKLNTITCHGCIVTDEIPHRVLRDPEQRLEFIELWTLDHSDCDKFHDARKAELNRQHRKEADRRKLLKRPVFA